MEELEQKMFKNVSKEDHQEAENLENKLLSLYQDNQKFLKVLKEKENVKVFDEAEAYLVIEFGKKIGNLEVYHPEVKSLKGEAFFFHTCRRTDAMLTYSETPLPIFTFSLEKYL